MECFYLCKLLLTLGISIIQNVHNVFFPIIGIALNPIMGKCLRLQTYTTPLDGRPGKSNSQVDPTKAPFQESRDLLSAQKPCCIPWPQKLWNNYRKHQHLETRGASLSFSLRPCPVAFVLVCVYSQLAMYYRQVTFTLTFLN